MNIVVTVGHEEFKIPAEREPEQIRRTDINRIFILVEKRIQGRTVLDLGTDIFAKHIQVRKRNAKHQAVAVSRFTCRGRNPAEDFHERVCQSSAITPSRDTRKQVQVLQAALFKFKLFGRERLPRLIQQFAIHHAFLGTLQSFVLNRRNDRTIRTSRNISKGCNSSYSKSKANYFHIFFHFLKI